MGIDAGVQIEQDPSINDQEATQSLEIPPEILEQLRRETNPEQRQKALDQLFPDDRREQLLASASKDSAGRPVRSFRRIHYDKLLQLLEKGEQTALDYYPDLHAAIDQGSFQHLLRMVERAQGIDGDILTHFSIAEYLDRIFKNKVPDDELEALKQDLTYKIVLPFVEKYVPLPVLKDAHTGSFAQKFSTLLSMSVGGIVSYPLRPDRAYLELVLPDTAVIPHEPGRGVEGEKEVFTKQLNLRNITRVYTSNDKLYQDEITNPHTPIGSYYAKSHSSHQAVEDWRWDEKTRDYLPTTLLQQTSS